MTPNLNCHQLRTKAQVLRFVSCAHLILQCAWYRFILNTEGRYDWYVETRDSFTTEMAAKTKGGRAEQDKWDSILIGLTVTQHIPSLQRVWLMPPRWKL